jgi:phosphoribosylglycinamide formyltransferase 2
MPPSPIFPPNIMHIGTPLSPSATRVMLLGAGELGKEVIIALQRLGCEVIAVDRYANAPGHQVAHRAHVIDMTDAHALRTLVEKEQPHFIVPEIEAIATDELARIEAAGLATVVPTARATQLTMNREGIRRLAAEELGLPTSPYEFADTLETFQAAVARIGFPCVVKPVMSSSGKGQSVLRSASDVQPAWEYAMTGGRVKAARVIIEGFIDFEYEITLLTVRANNAAGAIETSFCAPIGHLQRQGDYIESWQPQPMSALALQRSRDIADKVTTALGGRGLFGVELFVSGDQVWFSEVSPRPHDTGLVTLASQRFSEFELHARAILGLPVDTSQRRPSASAVIYGGVEAQEVIFKGLEDALRVEESDLRLFGKPESHERRRMGVAVAGADSIEEARNRATTCAGKVVVFGMPKIRAETLRDVTAIHHITRLAFANHPHSKHTEQRLVDSLRLEKGLSISLVAELDGDIVGHIAFSPASIDGKDVRWFALGPLSVRPDRQGRGIGQALVHAGLAQLREIGAAGCVLVGESAYYRRFGFRTITGITLEGVSSDVFLARPLGQEVPKGKVQLHQAFAACM